MSVGPAGVVGITFNFETWEWMPVAGAGIGSVTDLPIDPLVVDLDGDGVELIGLSGSKASFDFAGDGFAERTAWVAADDGLLVRDLNGNGRIETLEEMIGTATQDAYTVLRGLDVNKDGKITSADAVWSTLKIWQDADKTAYLLRSSQTGCLGLDGRHGIWRSN